MLLSNVGRTTLQNRANLLYLPSDEDLVHPALPPPSSFAGPSFSYQQPFLDYSELHDTLRSIQEEQASLRVYVASEHVALWDLVQERHDALRGTFASQTQYFRVFSACLET